MCKSCVSVCLSSAWIKVEQLKPYHVHKEEMIKINKGKRFQQAVDAVEDFLKKAKGKEQVRGLSYNTWPALCDVLRTYTSSSEKQILLLFI